MFKNRHMSARFKKIGKLSDSDRSKMYGIFERYYESTDIEVFNKDLDKKTGVILLYRKKDEEIVGFSTITEYYFITPNGKPACGVFSGDTIIQREYWGSRALQVRFFLYVLSKKLLLGRIPLYWLLISKGYKTYLLLANNFADYYPHPKGKNDHLEGVAKSYCDHLFPGVYNEETRLLDFGDDYQMLKDGVAEITDDLRNKVPKIAFFEQVNPTWKRGTELPCVGYLSYKTLFTYQLILVRKVLSRFNKSMPLRAIKAIR